MNASFSQCIHTGFSADSLLYEVEMRNNDFMFFENAMKRITETALCQKTPYAAKSINKADQKEDFDCSCNQKMFTEVHIQEFTRDKALQWCILLYIADKLPT